MLVVHIHQQALSIRWTWLPFWLAINPVTKDELMVELRDRVLLGGVTTSPTDLEAMHEWVLSRIEQRFPAFTGLRTFLDGLRDVQPGL